MIDISIKNVVKSFEIGAPLLDGFSMELREGERVGLLGRNGCGKTTLFRMITGQLLPDEGEITVAAGKRIGLISQIPWYPEEYTVENVLRSAFAELFALKKKWLPYLIGILIAMLIHPYALMYLIVPFMGYRPWTKKTGWMLVLFLAAGFLLRPLLGTVINITTMLGEEYTVSSFTGEGVNAFRVLVCNVPLLLSFVYRKRLFADSTKTENLMVNLTMLNGAIMFVGLFGTANYFARLANYFLIFQSLSLPWMLKKIGGREQKLLTVLLVLGYTVYFYYANVINQPFDQGFSRLSIAEYFALQGG